MNARQSKAAAQAERFRVKHGLVAPPPNRNALRVAATREKIAEAAQVAAEAEAARLSNPAETAKRILQQRGFVVFRAEVTGGPAGKWKLSGVNGFVDDAALIARADAVTGGGDRIAASKREQVMKTLNDAEATRLRDRGLSKSRVIDHLVQIARATGSTALSAARLGIAPSSFANFKGGHAPISLMLLDALYGPTGCALRSGLLDPLDSAERAKTRPVPLAAAAREAARVEPDQLGDAPADQPEPECTDVGDALERRRDAAIALPPPADPDPVIINPPMPVERLTHARAPVAGVNAALDAARLRLVAAADDARGVLAQVEAARKVLEREAAAAALLASIDADLAALDRTAALLLVAA